MAKKKRKDAKPEYRPTKRQLSHLQRQKRRQRLITIVGSVVVAGVVILLGVGLVTQWFVPVYLELNKTVLEVEGREFNVEYYIDGLDLYSRGNANGAVQYFDSILDDIKAYDLVTRKATELGYSVSNEDVKNYIANVGWDDNRFTRDYVTYLLILGQVREGEFASQVPDITEHRNVLAMFVESQSEADEIVTTVEGGEDFSEVAADSLDSYTSAENGELGWRPSGVIDALLGSDVLNDAVFAAENGIWNTLKDKDKAKDVGYWLIELLERNEDDNTVHVRAMLVSSEEEALNIRERVEAGEDFGELALEFSRLLNVAEDKGDLGFVSATSGNFTSVFIDFVFDNETVLNELSQPLADEDVSTHGGCWIFIVDGVEEREVDDENAQLLIGDSVTKWVKRIVDDPTIEVKNYLDDDIRVFAYERLSQG